MDKLPIPPYAKPLSLLQAQGYRPANDIYLFIGPHAWRKCAGLKSLHSERLMMIPPWLSPSRYFYPVMQCGVMLFDTGWAHQEYIDETVTALFRDGAKKVYHIPTNLKPLVIFHKDISHD